MIRSICLAIVVLFAVQLAQAAPRVSSSVADEQLNVGRATVIRVTVLVPTWFSKPVYFDAVQALNLISLEANKSTYPTSQSIDGETWTGVVKEYTVMPMVAGNFQVVLPSVKVHYRETDGTARAETIVPPPVQFLAQVPLVARDLDPLVIADNIELQQMFDRPEQPVAGDNIARRLTVKVEGSSALFIPPLLGEVSGEGVKTYVQSPVVKDELSGQSPVVNGTREELQNIRLQQAGSVALPQVTLRYYQPATDTIVSVSVPGVTVNVVRPPLTPRQWIILACVAAACLVFMVWCIHLLRPKLRKLWRSEPVEFRRLLWRSARPDRAFLQALEHWRHHWRNNYYLSPNLQAGYSELALAIERHIYSREPAPRGLAASLKAHRRSLKTFVRQRQDRLQPLNP